MSNKNVVNFMMDFFQKALSNTFLFKMYNVQEWMNSTSIKICSICIIQCFTDTPLLYLLKYDLYVGKMVKWAKVPDAKSGKPSLIPRNMSCLTSKQTQGYMPLKNVINLKIKRTYINLHKMEHVSLRSMQRRENYALLAFAMQFQLSWLGTMDILFHFPVVS